MVMVLPFHFDNAPGFLQRLTILIYSMTTLCIFTCDWSIPGHMTFCTRLYCLAVRAAVQWNRDTDKSMAKFHMCLPMSRISR